MFLLNSATIIPCFTSAANLQYKMFLLNLNLDELRYIDKNIYNTKCFY